MIECNLCHIQCEKTSRIDPDAWVCKPCFKLLYNNSSDTGCDLYSSHIPNKHHRIDFTNDEAAVTNILQCKVCSRHYRRIFFFRRINIFNRLHRDEAW